MESTKGTIIVIIILISSPICGPISNNIKGSLLFTYLLWLLQLEIYSLFTKYYLHFLLVFIGAVTCIAKPAIYSPPSHN